MKTGQRFQLRYISGVALLVAVWAFGSANVDASDPPQTTLPEYTGGVPYNQVKPYVGVSSLPGADVNVSNLVGNESEVSIDANPTDPNNQVIVGHAPNFSTMNTFFTLDGGLTWTLVALGSAQDGLASTFRFDPTVAFDENGNVYVAYGARTGPPNQITVVVAKSTDGGQNYTQFTQVATTPNIGNLPGNDKWHLATGPDPSNPAQQNVYIAWTQNVTEAAGTDQRIVVSGSTNGGATFSAPVIINDPSIVGTRAGNLFADPAVGPNGEVYVAWLDNSAEQVFVDVSLDRGITFGTDNLVTDSGTGFATSIPPQPDRGVTVGPTIDADQSRSPFRGRLYVTYTDLLTAGGLPDTDIFVRFSDDLGATWSARTLVNDDGGTNSQFLPWLDVDQKTGVVSVVWYDARNDPSNQLVEVFVAISTVGGVSFQPNILVSDGQSDQSTNNPNRTINNFLEYIGIAIVDLVAFLVWSDNSINAADLDFFTDQVPLGPVDIYFLVDLSSSFADDLSVFKAQAPEIISSLKASNSNIKFGLGKFEDYPIPPFGSASAGDKAYERLVDLTFDTDLVLSTISGLFTRFGADFPQSQLPALFQAATGAGQDLSEAGVGFPGASIPPGQQANFRDGATKLFLLWTDAPFHRPGDPGDIPYPGPSFNQTVQAIESLDPSNVIGISSGNFGIADLEAIVEATGSFAPPGGVDCDGDGTTDILEGEPLVCTIAPSGEGIGEAVTAIVRAAIEPAIIEVDIDIKPGSDPNAINPASKGLIPVAILTTEDFDALTVSPSTVQFGPAGASIAHRSAHLEDVDGDGELDLVLHFRTQESGILCGDAEASLTGETFDGQPIQGSDIVITVGCR